MAHIVKQNRPHREEADPQAGGAGAVREEGPDPEGPAHQREGPGDPVQCYTMGEFIDFCLGPAPADHEGDQGLQAEAGAVASPTGRARKATRRCSASTGTPSSRRKSWTRTSTTWRRPSAATTASWAASSTSSRSRTRRAPASSSGTPRAGSSGSRSRTSGATSTWPAATTSSTRPHIANIKLWKTSGHTEYYKANMYSPIDIEGVEYQLKPMNCPFHITIYKSQLHSYRELPFRYAELGTVYRFERSGVLHGLMRVRGFTQDDAHLFCRPDQLEAEIVRVIDFVTSMLSAFGFKEYDIYVSTKPDNASGQRRAVGDRHRGPEARRWRRAACRTTVDPGEGVVLRAQDRHQDQGLAGPRVAVLDHPGGLPQPQPLRPRVHRRGRQAPPAGDDPPRAARAAWSASSACSSSTTGARSRSGWRPTQAVVIPVTERHHDYGAEVAAQPEDARACASPWTTATRSWATRSARPRCRRCRTCWWWGTRKWRRAPSPSATARPGTSAPWRAEDLGERIARLAA